MIANQLLDPPVHSSDPAVWRAFYAECEDAGIPEAEWPLPLWWDDPAYDQDAIDKRGEPCPICKDWCRGAGGSNRCEARVAAIRDRVAALNGMKDVAVVSPTWDRRHKEKQKLYAEFKRLTGKDFFAADIA